MSKSIPWSYRPYRPYFVREENEIYICRIAPAPNAISFDWLGCDGETHSVFYRKRGEGDYILADRVKGTSYTLNDLATDTDYEFYVTLGERKSTVRLAHTGEAVGTVVNYLHPEDKIYAFSGHSLCSPSLVRHPEGYLLASMDVFEGNAPQNLTLIFRSDDDGRTWRYVSELMPCFWGKMFIHRGDLYMLAVSTEYGDLLIGKSTDGGYTFDAPTVILRGSGGRGGRPGVHKNPQPIVFHNGRIWETLEWGAWGAGYHAPQVMSCDENADLLDADNWVITPPVKYDPTWQGVAKGPSNGNIEGALAVAPDGRLYNIMRYDTAKTEPNYGLVLAYEVDTAHPEMSLRYSHAIHLDGNLSKFMIKKDEASGYYYSIISRITPDYSIHARNLLSLMRSKDLENWELVTDLLNYRHADPAKVGFQYVDFSIEGDDIIYLCRTAINGAYNSHDANYSTFHRIENFRDL